MKIGMERLTGGWQIDRTDFTPNRAVCMSGDYNGSSALTSSILGSVSQIAQAEILSHQSPSVQTPPLSRPVYSSPLVGSAGKSSMGTILLLIVVVIVGFFAYKKL